MHVLDDDTLIVVGGGSHAERLATAIGVRHQNVADLSLPGWKLNEATAAVLASNITGIINSKEAGKAVVILQ